MATVHNALGLLNLFSMKQPEIGLTQFKNLSGFDKGTTNRYLKALKSLGFLEQNLETKAYRLGPAVVRLALIREQTFPISKIVEIHTADLAEKTGELAHASLYTEEGMSSLCNYDGSISGARVGFDPAEILPLHATSSGIAMLAFGLPSLLENLSRSKLRKFTDKTHTDEETILKFVREASSLGYSHMSQSYEAEVASVALPFFDASGYAIGTLAVATPRFRMTDESKLKIISKAIDTSRIISTELGAQVPVQIDQKWASVQKDADKL